MLFYAVYEIVKESVNKLLGEPADEELVDRVKRLIKEVSGSEIDPHHFHLHCYGDHRELTFHIRLRGTMDIASGHRVAQQIESRLREEMEIEATIHVEPLEEGA